MGGITLENVAEIMKLIEGGLNQDVTKVYNYSQLLISKVEATGDVKTAKRLKSVINKSSKNEPMKSKEFSSLLKLPVDSESRLPLAEFKKYDEGSIFLSVDENLKSRIDEFIFLLSNADLFAKKGIRTHRTMLLYGEPGTGKTQIARYIASVTNLPLVVVRLDGIISSYLGSTSKNIRMLFDFVNRTPCILFLDEFDAIAKMRDDTNELGELKRVVNALLQNIDSMDSEIPVIAATNHKHLLDPAIWRRFDYKIQTKIPDQLMRENMIKRFLGGITPPPEILKLLVILTEGQSGSDIETFCNQIRTYLIVDDKETLEFKNVFNYYIKYKRGTDQNVDDIGIFQFKLDLASRLRKLDKKTFTYRTLARLSGISSGKLSQEIRKGGDKIA
jgi:SpoVK/Ycf46/Vps4 family AAA+-type ATPase